MNHVHINAATKASIRLASRQQIEDYYAKLSTGQKHQKWLRRCNRYRERCTEQYSHDLDSSKVDAYHLIEYIAASGPAHAIDGWSFLSRAVDAALRGDNNAGIHFGYYAELRAAMALLACEGIGIFNTKHPVIRDNGQIEHGFKGGTHAIIWPVLRHWATLKRASDLIEEIVAPDGHSLGEWLASLQGYVRPRAVAMGWLNTWGLDLSDVGDDHDLRNLASYRPSEFRRISHVNPEEVIEFTEDLWRMFEPGVSHRFPNIERFLLRRTLRDGGASSPSVNDLSSLGLDARSVAEWSSFLAKTDDPKPLIFANETAPVDDPHCHLQVISRAALLLYLATCATRRLLLKAGYTVDTVSFWWRRYGEGHSLWDYASFSGDPFDLWADVATVLDEARSWRLNDATSADSLYTWRRAQPSVVEIFGGLELVGIWGIIP